MATYNKPEFRMSIYRACRLTRKIPPKNTLLEDLGVYAESH